MAVITYSQQHRQEQECKTRDLPYETIAWFSKKIVKHIVEPPSIVSVLRHEILPESAAAKQEVVPYAYATLRPSKPICIPASRKEVFLRNRVLSTPLGASGVPREIQERQDFLLFR